MSLRRQRRFFMTKKDFTRDSDKRFTLRMDKDLFDIVTQSAKENKRSVGREIEYILEQHFKNNDSKK